MKQKAMDVKLVVRPLIGCLTHTHFWEGPCRAGRKEDMTVEAETKAADETFKSSVEALKDVISEVEFKEALDVRYNESFVVEKEMFDKIGEDVDEIDCFLCMGWRIPKLERSRKSGRMEMRALILQHIAAQLVWKHTWQWIFRM